MRGGGTWEAVAYERRWHMGGRSHIDMTRKKKKRNLVSWTNSHLRGEMVAYDLWLLSKDGCSGRFDCTMWHRNLHDKALYPQTSHQHFHHSHAVV